MHKRFTRHAGLFLLILLALAHVALPTQLALAGPAAGILEPLAQPDGTLIWARQIGDEWANGMATPDGYLILRDPRTSYWTYAEAGPDGSLRASALIVGQHAPAGIPRGLRPAPSLPALAIAEDGRTPADLPALAPALGSRAVLALFVDFTPSVRVGATPGSWNSVLFGPTGSAKQYYEETSYGGFTLVPAVESDVTLGGGVNDGVVIVTLPYAHPNTAGTTDDRNRRIVRDALLAADAFVDFAGYDTNGDGVIAANELNLLVVVAGYETAYSSSCGSSVWAHKWSLGGTVPTVTLDGKTVGGTYTQMGEWHCAASAPPGHQATIGTVVHELAHDLGLPDLYDTDDSSEGIGNWGLMGGGCWNKVGVLGDSPAHMDPWSKYVLGWITPTVVTGTLSNETISPAATTADVYQFLAGTPTSGEYFLVENRQRVGFDAGLSGQGLLIWHIDTAKTTNREECFPGGPSCATYHYKVAVVQADNLYHLEKGENRSCNGDPWPGTSGKQTFNDASTPNSRLYSGASSGVSITGITVVGTNITATLGPPLTVSLAADPSAPQPANTPITFTAAAVNGVAPYQYKWWVAQGGAWTMGQDWGPSPTFVWTPTAGGTYTVQVWARSSGSTADAAEGYRQLTYTVTPPGSFTVTSLTADKPSDQRIGTTITFTATATGGVAPIQYKWWLYNGRTWSVGQPWSTSTTFAWMPTVPGAYTIQVWARNAGTTTDTAEAFRQFGTPYVATGITLGVISLTADKAAPQPANTPITFTAAAVDGVAPYQYKWWVAQGGAWTMGQDWGPSPTFVRTPTAGGTYTVQVWARSSGSTADAAEGYRQLTYTVTPPGSFTVTSLTADPSAPQPANTPITFTAAAVNGVAPYQYKWWVAQGGAWTMGQDWGPSPTFVWTPTAGGTYTVQVWARSSGSTADAAEGYRQLTYTVTPPGSFTVTSLTADKPSDQRIGTTITFTATATGGVAPIQYKWWLYNGRTWSVGQPWSTSTTFAWMPTVPGAYTIQVWARNAGTTTDTAEAFRQFGTPYVATGITLGVISLTADKAAPQPANTPITFTAAAVDGVAPYQYKWWVAQGGAWTMGQDWGPSPTFVWTPTAGGTYTVQVWARNAGATADAPEAYRNVTFTITVITVTSLTADTPSPQSLGTPITFTAAAVNGVAPYQYKWWVAQGGAWTMGQDWGPSPTFVWTPTAGGTYTVQVWARNAGATADAPEAYRNVTFTITVITVTSLTADRPSPQPPWTPITFTASATGGVAPYQYKWWVAQGGAWTMGQDWGPSSTFVWTPSTTGTYTVQVWARNAGTTTDTAEAHRAIGFIIQQNQQSQVRFLNDTCLLPNCALYTARLTAEEGYTWDSFSGVFSPYQTVTSPTLSNFHLEAVGIGPLGSFSGTFNLASGRRYAIVLTVDETSAVLGLYDEGVATGATPETLGTLKASIPGRVDADAPVRLAPAQKAPALR